MPACTLYMFFEGINVLVLLLAGADDIATGDSGHRQVVQ